MPLHSWRLSFQFGISTSLTDVTVDEIPGRRKAMRLLPKGEDRGATLEQHRADLTHIDGVLRLFQPDRDPAEIKPKRTYARRTRYFARNELSRLTMDALRVSDGALQTTDEIAGRVIDAKGFDAADAVLRGSIRDQVLTLLRSYRKRGTVEQIGLGRSGRWKSRNDGG